MVCFRAEDIESTLNVENRLKEKGRGRHSFYKQLQRTLAMFRFMRIALLQEPNAGEVMSRSATAGTMANVLFSKLLSLHTVCLV